MLRKNGYPTRFLDKIISKFPDKNFKKQATITTVAKKTLLLILPYLGTQSLKLKKNLNKLFKEQLPPGKLEMVFRTTQRMSSCFRFKDVISCSLLSGVIYEYKCPICNARQVYRFNLQISGEKIGRALVHVLLLCFMQKANVVSIIVVILVS